MEIGLALPGQVEVAGVPERVHERPEPLLFEALRQPRQGREAQVLAADGRAVGREPRELTEVAVVPEGIPELRQGLVPAELVEPQAAAVDVFKQNASITVQALAS